jgi:hypothetical protein
MLGLGQRFTRGLLIAAQDADIITVGILEAARNLLACRSRAEQDAILTRIIRRWGGTAGFAACAGRIFVMMRSAIVLRPFYQEKHCVREQVASSDDRPMSPRRRPMKASHTWR